MVQQQRPSNGATVLVILLSGKSFCSLENFRQLLNGVCDLFVCLLVFENKKLKPKSADFAVYLLDAWLYGVHGM